MATRISGGALRAVAALSRVGWLRRRLFSQLKKDLDIDALDRLASERGGLPIDVRPWRARADRRRSTGDPRGAPSRASRDWPRTSAVLVEAYARGEVTPREVTERAIAGARALAEQRPSVGPMLEIDEAEALRAADASSDRYRRRASLGPLDGVVVGIKEEVDVRGLATQAGTRFRPAVAAAEDATVVAKLRAAGAVVIGNTPMTEYGMSPLGFNPHRRMPRNPHDVTRAPGGSSSGSGVGVAAGVFPVALGADGGGSIRVPSALNGVFGIKPTFGRISRTGHAIDGSMSNLGPIGASTLDLAAFLEATSGEDPRDDLTRPSPPVAKGELVAALGRGVSGLRVGVLDEAFEQADPEIARAGREALQALGREGAELVSVRLRWLGPSVAMGYLTIGLEAYTTLAAVPRAELGADLRILCAVLGEFEPQRYLDVQKMRTLLRAEAAETLRGVDVLALPTTERAAPAFSDEQMRTGVIDPSLLDAMCRFVFLGNLTGLPAASAPVGTVGALPVGLQIVGDAWDEATVLQVLAHLERIGVARVEKPAVHIDLLGR